MLAARRWSREPQPPVTGPCRNLYERVGLAVGFYDDQIVPRVLSVVMATKELAQVRARRLQPVEGTVLEVGFGSGLNLPHYGANVSKLYALDPSRVGLQLAKKRLSRVSFPVELLALPADGRITLDDASVDAVVTTGRCARFPIPSPLCARCIACCVPAAVTTSSSTGSRPIPPSRSGSTDSIRTRWRSRAGATSPARSTPS